MNIDFYFDVTCPWCWITSRWLTEVATVRDIDISWRTFSLAMKNHDPAQPPPDRAVPRLTWATGILRVAEAARDAHGNDAVGRLYTEAGYRYHNDHVRFPHPSEIVAAAGLPEELERASDDEGWDAAIRTSMEALDALAGDDIGVPSIAFDGRVAYFGPVMTPAPTGDEAIRLWDGLVTLSSTTGLYELKRTRTSPPEFPQRP